MVGTGTVERAVNGGPFSGSGAELFLIRHTTDLRLGKGGATT